MPKIEIKKQNNLKIPQGFVAAKSKKGKHSWGIKIKKNTRLLLTEKKAKAQKVANRKWQKIYRGLLKKEHQDNPVPEGTTRRIWQKLHKLPTLFKVKGGPPYRVLSRKWWDRFSRERQIEFHKFFNDPTLKKIFPVNSTRLQKPTRAKLDTKKAKRPSPSQSAKLFKPGSQKKGGNGKMWIVSLTKAKTRRWTQL